MRPLVQSMIAIAKLPIQMSVTREREATVDYGVSIKYKYMGGAASKAIVWRTKTSTGGILSHLYPFQKRAVNWCTPLDRSCRNMIHYPTAPISPRACLRVRDVGIFINVDTLSVAGRALTGDTKRPKYIALVAPRRAFEWEMLMSRRRS